MKKILTFCATILIGIVTCSGQCPLQDSTEAPAFIFRGFTLAEVRGTLVKDLYNNVVVDSFYMRTDGIYDTFRLQYYAGFTFHNRIKLNDTYQFFIPGYPPYTLSNMKIIPQQVMPTATLCIVQQYDLNGITYKNSTLEFIKDGANKILQKKIDDIKARNKRVLQ